MRNRYRLFFLFLYTLVQISTGPYAFSQVSPVQIVPAVFAPYSTLLSEYYSGTSTRLSVTLINTDFNEPLLKVYMRMTIEGQGVKLQSNVYGNYPVLELTPGLPVVVSQSDLAPYFSARNLQVAASAGGLRPQVRLPEGYYQFSFEAFEVNTGRIVGNKQSAQAYLTLSDPPFLTMPEKGMIVPVANPFNLLFQWTPRHLSNPNAFNTEYTFDLVEIWDEGIAPEAAFYTSRPIYSTTLTTTNLFYGPAEPPLIVGKRYAWRVQATLVTDNNDQEPFRNNGYSEIYWFKLQSDCPLIQRADIVSDPHTNKTSMSWTPDFSSIGGFKMDYRKKGSTIWTTVDAPSNTTTLTGLSWNTEYEYRLANRCVITDEFAYGGLQSFRTLNQDTTKCVPSQPKAITNTEPLAKLQPGDTIYASGFQMRLTQVTGSNGQFSGEGYLGLLIPTTTTEVSVKASFHNISVNTDKELFAGKIVSIYDRNEGGIANVDEFFEGGQGEGSTKTGATAAIAVNTVVDPSKKAIISTSASSSGETTYEVTVTGTDGKPVTFQAKKLPVVIQDKSGKIYTIDKDGTIKNAGAGGAAQQQILAGKGPEALNLLNADKGTVTFEAHTDQTYALDTYQPAYNKSALFSQKYESLVQGKYRVANKLLVANSIDKIQATISDLDESIPADSIHFITGKGIEFSAVKLSSTTFEITLLSGPESDAQELYAVYRDSKAAGANTDPTIESSSFTYSLGKLNIATYAAKQLKVTLVSVGTATIDEQQVQQKLNEIYNKIGVSWIVSKAAPFTDLSWDANTDGRLDVKDAGKNNLYSAEMQALNDAYVRTGIDAATPYLFIFNTAPLNNDQTLKGDMLRNKQFGYLFMPLTDAGTVAAHELAHGMFHLNHTFDTQYKFKEGDLADNLMDYRGGSNLVKLQWDAIHAPGLVIGVFEKEGDAAYNNNAVKLIFYHTFAQCPKKVVTCRSYLSPFFQPYESSWAKVASIPTYWVKVDDAMEPGDLDDNGTTKRTPYLIKLNSPMSFSGYVAKNEGDYIDGLILEKTFVRTGVDGIMEDYEIVLDAWIAKNYKPANDASTQSSAAIEKLAIAILKGGELDPGIVCTLSSDILYGARYQLPTGLYETVYYNSDEMAAWVWGNVAYQKLGFSHDQAIAFGMQYFGKPSYSVIYGDILYDVPWKVKAMKEGWMYSKKTYDNINMNYHMNGEYYLSSSYLVNGIGFDDLVEFTFYVYTGGASTASKKITVHMAKNMVTAALTNYLVQTSILMIGGKTYIESINSVNYYDVAWTGLTDAIKNENEAMAIDCIKEMVDKYEDLKNKKSDINISLILTRECAISLIKNKLFAKYLTGPTSPYAQMLKRSFKNQTLNQIKSNIRTAFGCTPTEINQILATIPKEILDELINEIKK